jgi:hypothetical protein
MSTIEARDSYHQSPQNNKKRGGGETKEGPVQWPARHKKGSSGRTDLATACNTRGETPTKTPSMTRQVRQAH